MSAPLFANRSGLDFDVSGDEQFSAASASLGVMAVDLIRQRLPLPSVLDALCNSLDERLGGYSAAIALTDSSRSKMQHVAGRPSPDNPPWRRSSPVISMTGEILGVLAISSQQDSNTTAPLPLTVTQRLSHLVSSVIERHQWEETLQDVRSELAHVARAMSLGALSASIAHEVNQPLCGIIINANACLRMLAATPPDVEGARKTARRAIRDGQRASDVVRRVRALFARIRGSTIELLDLNENVQELLALVFSELRKHGAIVRTELASGLPRIKADGVQLQQVILNLLLNAAEAMKDVVDRPREVLVTTQREAEGVRLSVRDAGVGIEPQHQGRIFEAFYSTKAGGMGIGLSISRSIVEQHGGRLWMESNDRHGTTFSFSIPGEPIDASAGDLTRPVSAS
jgi:signal transduction histidine kinase